MEVQGRREGGREGREGGKEGGMTKKMKGAKKGGWTRAVFPAPPRTSLCLNYTMNLAAAFQRAKLLFTQARASEARACTKTHPKA